MRRFLTIAAIAILGALSSQAVFAAEGEKCRAEIMATGSASLTESGAKAKAIQNWRRSVIANYGEFYGSFENAKDTKVGCTKTLMGLMRCEVRGRPCPQAASVGPREIACTADDSPNCDPGVKWAQTQLSAKGCPTRTDGSAGPSTSRAVLCFQRKSKISDTGDLDQATLKALE